MIGVLSGSVEVILIQYDAVGRPETVGVRDESGAPRLIHLQWCRRDGVLYASVLAGAARLWVWGSGRDAPLWVRSPEAVVVAPGGVLAALAEPLGPWGSDGLLDRADVVEGHTVPCATCDDHVPTEALCEHVWYCLASARWSTPSERCEADCAECG